MNRWRRESFRVAITTKQNHIWLVINLNMKGVSGGIAVARYPAQFMGESGFYGILIISFFYQKIINMS